MSHSFPLRRGRSVQRRHLHRYHSGVAPQAAAPGCSQIGSPAPIPTGRALPRVRDGHLADATAFQRICNTGSRPWSRHLDTVLAESADEPSITGEEMNTDQLHMPRRRRHMSATLFGTAAIALAVGGLAQAAVSHAEWDIAAYDECLKTASTVTCCAFSGGDWDDKGPHGKCVAPAATAQTWPQNWWEVGPAAQQGTATPAQTTPQPPAAPPVVVGDTQWSAAPQPPAAPPPVVRDHRQR
jgi:hypothetical protein